MRVHRRGFLGACLRLGAGAWAWLTVGLRRRGAAAGEANAAGRAVHRATRNTGFGAVGPQPPRPPGAPFKEYPEHARNVLAKPGPAAGASLAAAIAKAAAPVRFGASEIPLDELARLLHHTNGVTERRETARGAVLLRAAPSAGALYAGEVYVVAERVQGLAPGVYSYHVRDHALVLLREGEFLREAAAALEHPDTLSGAACAVLIANVYRRSTWRYANRGYRYAWIDTGHIGENLRLEAAGRGFGVHTELRFADARLDRLLGLEADEEEVAALHAVGRLRKEEASERPGPRRSLVPEQPVDVEDANWVGAGAQGIARATRLALAPALEGGVALEREGSEGKAGRASPPSEASHRLPPPAEPDAPLEAAIRIRRSTRRFETGPVSPEELAFVAGSALGAGGRDARVEGWLVCHEVRGIERGLYRLRVEGDSLALERRRAGDLRAALARVCLGQDKAARAAVAFLFVAPIAVSARGYRNRLVAAGAAAQRVYLAAEALGLTARNLAAFVDDEIDALVGLDREREAVVHLTLLGRGD